MLAPPAVAGEALPGFRGIPWGAPISDFADELQPVPGWTGSRDPDLIGYTRRNDQRSIGQAAIERLTYAFYDGKFHSVFIEFVDSPSDKLAIVEAFKAQYPSLRQPNRYIEQYHYAGPANRALLNCGRSNSGCTALILSTAMAELRDRNRKAAAEKAKSDF